MKIKKLQGNGKLSKSYIKEVRILGRDLNRLRKLPGFKADINNFIKAVN